MLDDGSAVDELRVGGVAKNNLRSCLNVRFFVKVLCQISLTRLAKLRTAFV